MVRQGNRAQRQQQAAEDVDAAAAGHAPGSATLFPRPRTLQELWTEWMVGIGGRKPAKDFTTQERNHRLVKQKYYRRKVVWDKIRQLIDAGSNEQDAMYRIRQCYGFRMSVTQVINFMLHDRRTRGGHPNLAV